MQLQYKPQACSLATYSVRTRYIAMYWYGYNPSLIIIGCWFVQTYDSNEKNNIR